MSRSLQLCIFGGTFSPFHRGHTTAVLAYLEQYRPDRMLIMPAAIPPHKAPDPGVSPLDRLQMARLACQSLPGYGERVSVSDFEIEAGDRSYTWRTLEHFSHEDVALTFLCGTDMFLSLENWRCPERIFALSRIAYFDRFRADRAVREQIAQKAAHYREHFGADIVSVSGDCVEISSTALRRSIAAHENTDAYLDPRVRDYIESHGLYREEEEIPDDD